MPKRFVIAKSNAEGNRLINEYIEKLKVAAHPQATTKSGLMHFMEQHKPEMFAELSDELKAKGYELKSQTTHISVSILRAEPPTHDNAKMVHQQPPPPDNADETTSSQTTLTPTQQPDESAAQELFRACLGVQEGRKKFMVYRALGLVNQQTATYVGYGLFKLARSTTFRSYTEQFGSAFDLLEFYIGVSMSLDVLKALNEKLREIPMYNEGLKLLGEIVRHRLAPAEGTREIDAIRNEVLRAPTSSVVTQTLNDMITTNSEIQTDGIPERPVPPVAPAAAVAPVAAPVAPAAAVAPKLAATKAVAQFHADTAEDILRDIYNM